MKLLVTAVLLLTVTGAAVLTGAETRRLTGTCWDGPEGGNCVTERLVDWDGPLLVPLGLTAFVVLALAFWLIRRAMRWLTYAVIATVVAVAFAVYAAA
jgi:hypothetical protein